MFYRHFKTDQKTGARGFAIGMILMVIVLMAALATMMSATSIDLRIDREVQEVDIVRFTDQTRKVAGGIDRIVKTNCDDTDAAFTACINTIRDALRQPAPCEQDPNMAVQRHCPFHNLYGSAMRQELDARIFAPGADRSWELIPGVLPQNSDPSDANFAVLIVNNLDENFCRMLERRLGNNPQAAIPNGTELRRGLPNNRLSFSRTEACFRYDSGGPRYMYYIVASTYRDKRN